MARPDEEPEEMAPQEREEYEAWLERVSKTAIEEEERKRKMQMVSFTQESWQRFKERYRQAVLAAEEQFSFEGREYVTAFAKYFIEYHDSRFGCVSVPKD